MEKNNAVKSYDQEKSKSDALREELKQAF